MTGGDIPQPATKYTVWDRYSGRSVCAKTRHVRHLASVHLKPRLCNKPSLCDQVADVFHGRNRWMTVLVWAHALIVSVLASWTEMHFFNAETTRTQIAYPTGFIVCFQLVEMPKMWV